MSITDDQQPSLRQKSGTATEGRASSKTRRPSARVRYSGSGCGGGGTAGGRAPTSSACAASHCRRPSSASANTCTQIKTCDYPIHLHADVAHRVYHMTCDDYHFGMLASRQTQTNWRRSLSVRSSTHQMWCAKVKMSMRVAVICKEACTCQARE